MTFSTKLKKLRRMSFGEVTCRIQERAKRSIERRQYRSVAAMESPAGSPAVADELVSRCQAIFSGGSPGEAQRLESSDAETFRELQKRAYDRAKKMMEGEWRLLGLDVELGQTIDWHRDPKTGGMWKRAFYGDVSTKMPQSDVKFVWGLSRHQFLAVLSRHSCYSNSTDVAQFVDKHLQSWIAANPVYEGIHWTSALEPAMRAIAWVNILSSMGGWYRENWRQTRTIAASFADHANYLVNHLSYYSSPFNHLIGEAVGLYLISFIMREHKHSGKWRSTARNVLENHSRRQFYEDGMSVEQAMGYHFYTLGFLMLAVVVARLESEPLTEVERVAHRGFQTGLAFRRPDGTWPQIGDLDSARALPFCPDEYWDFGTLCSAAAVLFDDPELAVDDRPGEELFSLFGVEGVTHRRRLRSMQGPPTETSQALLAESGYAMASRGRDWFLFDSGPIAGGLFSDGTPSTAHGHADSLQVLYSCDGTEVLSERGIASYADATSANYFRSASAHSTLEIEGLPCARHAGHLAWSNVVAPPELRACLSTDLWITRGRLNVSDNARIARYVLGLPGHGVWIADLVTTDRDRTVSWNWQLGAERYDFSEQSGVREWASSNGSAIRTYGFQSGHQGDLAIADANSEVGWKALNYGERSPGSRLTLREQVNGTKLFVTFVGKACSSWQFQQAKSADGSRCEPEGVLQSDTHQIAAEFTWSIRSDESRKNVFAGLSSDANVSPELTEINGVGSWRCAMESTEI